MRGVGRGDQAYLAAFMKADDTPDPHNLFNRCASHKTRLAPGSLSLRDKMKGFRSLGCFMPEKLTSLKFANS